MTLHQKINTLLRSELPVHMPNDKVETIATKLVAVIEDSAVTLSENQYKDVLNAEYAAQYLENDRV